MTGFRAGFGRIQSCLCLINTAIPVRLVHSFVGHDGRIPFSRAEHVSAGLYDMVYNAASRSNPGVDPSVLEEVAGREYWRQLETIRGLL